MGIAFIVDPLGSLKADEDSSISMMGASWREGQVVANPLRLTVHADNTHWHDTETAETR